ncbi:MAG: PD-(D/E)XK nuclease family protein [Steroidobacteraceae bacterium]
MDALHPGLLAALAEGFTVLVPNRRVAHALRTAYGEHVLATGRRAWLTPDVLTTRAWIERMWFSLRPDSRRLLSPQQALVLWERIVAESPAAATLLNPSSAAKAAARSWDLAQAYGIALPAIEAEGGEEALVFADWGRQFEERCHARGWLPASRLPHELVSCELLPTCKVQLALREGPTPAERALLNRLAESGSVVREELATGQSGTTQVFIAIDADQEVLSATRWARTQLDAGRKSIGLVVPSLATRRHAIRRLLEDAFIPASRRSGEASRVVPFTIEANGALAEFPIVRSALDVLDLVKGDAPSWVAGRLLRSPFLAGFTTEAAPRALADARLRADGTEQLDVASFERLAGANGCPLLATHFAAMRAALPRTREVATASEWAERFLTLWTNAGWPGDRTPSSDEQQTLAKLNDALSSFGGLDDLLGKVSLRSAVAEFQQWASSTAYEPQTLPAPITVVDPESVSGMRFEALWLLGCEAARLPPAPEPDPFLPLRLQQQAGVPGADATATRERAERAFADLRSAADLIVCSWSRHIEDAEQTPSPLLDGLEPFTEAINVQPSLAGWLQDQRPALATLVDDVAPPVPAGRASGGARVVELQAWCAFRAQAELRLGARPLDQVSPGVDARERGTLLHKALEALWGEFGSQQGLLAVPEEALHERVFRTLDRLSVPLLKGASPHRARLLRIEVDIATRKLCDLLALERERQSFKVLERPEYAETYTAAGITLDLKIDRIDILDAGGEVVIDYKTGNSAQSSKWWGDRPEQPQLPLYAVARREDLAAVAFALLNAKESGFAGVAVRDGILPAVKATKSEWHSLLDDWQTAVDGLIGAYARGDARVDPLPQLCNRCHLAGLCRVHESSSAAGLDEVPL